MDGKERKKERKNEGCCSSKTVTDWTTKRVPFFLVGAKERGTCCQSKFDWSNLWMSDLSFTFLHDSVLSSNSAAVFSRSDRCFQNTASPSTKKMLKTNDEEPRSNKQFVICGGGRALLLRLDYLSFFPFLIWKLDKKLSSFLCIFRAKIFPHRFKQRDFFVSFFPSISDTHTHKKDRKKKSHLFLIASE